MRNSILSVHSILHISNKLSIRYRCKNQAICMIIGVILLTGFCVGSYFIVKLCLTPATSGSEKSAILKPATKTTTKPTPRTVPKTTPKISDKGGDLGGIKGGDLGGIVDLGGLEGQGIEQTISKPDCPVTSAGRGRLEVIQLVSVRPKPGFGTGNRNQDQVSVLVEEKCFAFDQSKIRDKEDAEEYCKDVFGHGLEGRIYEPRTENVNNAVLAKWVEFNQRSSRSFWLGIEYNERNREWLYDSDEKEFSIPSWIENKSSRFSKSECAKQIQSVGKPNLYQIDCSDEKSFTVCEIAGMP